MEIIFLVIVLIGLLIVLGMDAAEKRRDYKIRQG
jgi:hypothetical protein